MTKTRGLLFTAGIVLATAFTFSGCNEKEAAANTFTDPRDGKAYKKVKIGEQVWMAENLNHEASGSKCYENKPENCAKYGRLYDWNTARKACPKGWHLPSDAEWDVLMVAVGGVKDEYGWQGAGKKLKAASEWNKDGNGTDEFGFSALPGGFVFSDGSFLTVGDEGYWWSASEHECLSNYAYNRKMDSEREYAHWSWSLDSTLFNVRCVQDNDGPSPAAAPAVPETMAFAAPETPKPFTDSRDGKKLPSLKPSETGEFVSEILDPADWDGAYGFRADPNGKYYHFGSFLSEGDTQWDGCSYQEKFTATSTLAPQGKVNYSAENLQNDKKVGCNWVGGIRSTTWCDGVKGYGTGERVTMSIKTQAMYEDVVSFYRLLIVNGYANTAATWKKNTRVKTLRLYVGGKAWCDLQLSDVMKPQIFRLPENLLIVPAKSGKVVSKGSKFPAYQTDLTFEIIEVYPGDKYDDTCITGIALDILTSGVY